MNADKKRLNSGFKYYSAYVRNDLYRRFEKTFDLMLEPNSYQHQGSLDSNPYVNNSLVEEQIDRFKNSIGHNFTIMLGDIGVGKSTYVRNLLINNKTPKIDGDSIYLPILGNSQTITKSQCENQVLSIIDSAIDTIEEEFSLKFDPNLFYKYIIGHNKPLLFKKQKVNRELAKIERLEILLESDPYAYNAELIKYYCESKNVCVSNIVIIVDDYEGIDPEVQQYLYNRVSRLFQCLFNNNDQRIAAKMIIALRPHMYQSISNKDIATTYKPNVFEISDVVPLRDIIYKRFDTFRRMPSIYGKINDIEKYDEAAKVFEHFLSRFQDDILDIIQNLCNSNIRDSLIVLSSVMSNRKWFQKRKGELRSSFQPKISDFHISTINVIKSMIYNDGEMFSDKVLHSKTMDKPLIVNIFNHKTECNFMVCAYLIKLFWEFHHQYDVIEITHEKIIECMSLFDLEESIVSERIDYLIENDLIEINRSNDTLSYIYRKKIDGIFSLMKLSILYAFSIRDDIYINHVENKPSGQYTGKEFIKEAVRLIDIFISEETNLLSKVLIGPNGKKIKNIFGEKPISSLIFEGFENDYHARSNVSSEEIKNINSGIRSNLNELENIYKG